MLEPRRYRSYPESNAKDDDRGANLGWMLVFAIEKVPGAAAKFAFAKERAAGDWLPIAKSCGTTTAQVNNQHIMGIDT